MVTAMAMARSIWPAATRFTFSTDPPLTSAVYWRAESATESRLAMAPPSG